MIKKFLSCLALSVLLWSCYPVSTFIGPDLLPEGKESLAIGFSAMGSTPSFEDTTANEQAVRFGEGAVMFRRGIGGRGELGLKFVNLPWKNGMVMGDYKFQLINTPVQATLDMAISFWQPGTGANYQGLHPSILLGYKDYFIQFQYNQFTSSLHSERTQALFLGHQIKKESSIYTMTPIIGIHRSDVLREKFYYSLGFSFSQSLDDWSFYR